MIDTGKLPGTLKDRIRPFLVPGIPRRISSRFRSPTSGNLDAVASALKQYYFSPDPMLEAREVRSLFDDHLFRRLDQFRGTIIPWLAKSMDLQDLKVLEIGCGTGSSTVALAEQGAQVMAVDIDESSLEVARRRCQEYALNVRFEKGNATDVHLAFQKERFDLIIFFAVLEHMTCSERLDSMSRTWQMLKPGAFWCLVDTPNRLWFMDRHTSHLAFYHWLPDDIALLFSRFSPRSNFNRRFKEISSGSRLDFLRQGRGISYHEFTLAMSPVEQLHVTSSLSLFLRRQSLLRWITWNLSLDSRYEKFLRRVGPKIHRGFYQPSLDLLVRKT